MTVLSHRREVFVKTAKPAHRRSRSSARAVTSAEAWHAWLDAARKLAGSDSTRTALIGRVARLVADPAVAAAVPPKTNQLRTVKPVWRRVEALILEALESLLKVAAVYPASAKREKASAAEMLKAGLHAFWSLSPRWHLTEKEQAALLAVSESTVRRWKENEPTKDAVLHDRLRIVLLTYQRLLELTGGDDDVTETVFRQAGSAEDPNHPDDSLLTALSSPSPVIMATHYQRLESLIHAS